MVVIPPLAARFLGGSAVLSDNQKKPWILAQLVSNLVSTINRRVSTRVLTVACVCSVAFLGSWLLAPATEYLPSGNQNLVFGIIASPPGYSLDEFKRAALIVEEGDPNDPTDGLRPFWEVSNPDGSAAKALPPVQIALGKDGDEIRTVQPPPINNFFFVAFGGTAFMGCTSQVDTNVKPLEDVMNRAGSRVPGVFAFFSQTSLFGGGFSGGNSVDLEIRGDDQDGVRTPPPAIL